MDGGAVTQYLVPVLLLQGAKMDLSFGRIIAAGVLILVTHLLYILFFGADIFEVAGMLANGYTPPRDPNFSIVDTAIKMIAYALKTYIPFSIFALPVYWLIGTKLIPVLRAGDLELLGFEKWSFAIAAPFLLPVFIFPGLVIPFEVFHKKMGFSANAYMMAPFYATFATLAAFIALHFTGNIERREAYQKIDEQNRQNTANAQAAKRRTQLEHEAQLMAISVEGHKRKTEISLDAAKQLEAVRLEYKVVLDDLRDERDQRRRAELEQSADFYYEQIERMKQALGQ